MVSHLTRVLPGDSCLGQGEGGMLHGLQGPLKSKILGIYAFPPTDRKVKLIELTHMHEMENIRYLQQKMVQNEKFFFSYKGKTMNSSGFIWDRMLWALQIAQGQPEKPSCNLFIFV